MKKVFIILISSVVLIASVFAGCSQKDTETGAVTSEAVTQNGSVQTASGETTAEDSTSATAESSKSDTTTTTKKSENKTTTKAQNQSAAKTTTKAAAKTTAKATTNATTKATTKSTTKATTKKPTTKATVKNVSARDVQNQVNAYIRSRGITVDSSLNSGNSGWSYQISRKQQYLNDGSTLRNCKNCVDAEIAEMGTNISLYCYYDSDAFYICYMMNWG